MQKDSEQNIQSFIKKKEQRTFDQSIFSQVPPYLPTFFQLSDNVRMPNFIFQGQSQNQERASQQQFPFQQNRLIDEVDLQSQQDNREPPQQFQDQNEIATRISLSQMTQILFKLLNQQGIVQLKILKKKFLQRVENEKGKVNQKNLNRRFYDIKNLLVQAAVLKENNKRISLMQDLQLFKNSKIKKLKQDIQEKKNVIQRKKQDLKHFCSIKNTVGALIDRNKKDKRENQKLELPLLAVSSTFGDIDLDGTQRKGQIIIISGKRISRKGDYELLKYLTFL